MRILAIDPGYDRLGVAVLERKDNKEILLFSDCIQTERTDVLADRLHALGVQLQSVIDRFSPNALGMETLFFNKNQTTALGVAQVRGIATYLGKSAGCPLYEVSPQQVKVAVTGYGKSDKKAVMDMVKRLIPSVRDDALDDEYDAVAVGITCLAHFERQHTQHGSKQG